jgi:hypothetical protein
LGSRTRLAVHYDHYGAHILGGEDVGQRTSAQTGGPARPLWPYILRGEGRWAAAPVLSWQSATTTMAYILRRGR